MKSIVKINERLELNLEDHDELGEVFTIYSPVDEETGAAAYFIDTIGTGKNKEELGMGFRLTRVTATKLGWQLLKALGEV